MHRPFQDNGGAIVQRMSNWSIGLNPFQAVSRQRKLLEAWRADCHGVYGGTDIVQKSGERKRRGSGAAADFRSPFVHRDVETRAGKQNRGGKTIRT